jgi:AcrR family transcriptional regulator
MSAPTSKPTPRKPAGIRRREIAAAVLRLIGERGAPALTAATIAEAVGVTPGALFRHFESVDAILSAAVALAIEQVEATFPPADLPAQERLRALLLARIEVIRQTPGLAWLLLSDQVFLSVPAPSVELLHALVARSRNFVLEALREGIAAGSLRSDVEAEVMLVLFSGTIHALAAKSGVHGKGAKTAPKRPRPAHIVDTLFELLSNARAPHPTPPTGKQNE